MSTVVRGLEFGGQMVEIDEAAADGHEALPSEGATAIRVEYPSMVTNVAALRRSLLMGGTAS